MGDLVDFDAVHAERLCEEGACVTVTVRVAVDPGTDRIAWAHEYWARDDVAEEDWLDPSVANVLEELAARLRTDDGEE